MANSILMDTLTDSIIDSAERFSKQMKSSGVFAFRSTNKIFNEQLQSEFKINAEGLPVGVPHVSVSSENTEVFNEVGMKVLDSLTTQSFNNSIGVISRKPNALNKTIKDFYSNKFGATSDEAIREGNGMVSSFEQQILNSMDATSLFNNILAPAIDGMVKDMNNRVTVSALYSNAEQKIQNRFDNYLRPLATAQLQTVARTLEEHYASSYNELKWVSYVRRSTLPPERREFCNDHESNFAGNPRTHYHINEVKYLWPNYEGGDWEGRIPNTNTNSILAFAGGYNCLHSFEYTNVKSVKKADITAARNNLKGSGHSI